MAEKKILRLTCPVCEKNLRVADTIERFACLNCGTELLVTLEEGLAHLRPSEASTSNLNNAQQSLIEVNTRLKTADDTYGVGCAIATMSITLAACILLSAAVILQSQLLFWLTIALALVALGFILFIFIAASSRGTEPLLRQRDELQATVANSEETTAAVDKDTSNEAAVIEVVNTDEPDARTRVEGVD